MYSCIQHGIKATLNFVQAWRDFLHAEYEEHDGAIEWDHATRETIKAVPGLDSLIAEGTVNGAGCVLMAVFDMYRRHGDLLAIVEIPADSLLVMTDLISDSWCQRLVKVELEGISFSFDR